MDFIRFLQYFFIRTLEGVRGRRGEGEGEEGSLRFQDKHSGSKGQSSPTTWFSPVPPGSSEWWSVVL